MSALDEVIRRLEAGESGREVDRDICRAVFQPFATNYDREMGEWEVLWKEPRPNQPRFFDEIPRYTTSVDAAMGLAPEGHDIAISQASGPGRTDWYGYCEERDEYGRKPRHMGNAATPALALCIAALKARQAKARADAGSER